jgi:hypothetical protein
MDEPCAQPVCYAPTRFEVELDMLDASFVLGAIEERGCTIDSFLREALINHAQL